MSASPFKFLDSYTRADIGDFFGRDKETDELFRQCFLSPILVVYGGSGTGKTSLVQCGLSSRFQDSDWLPVPVRRSGDMIASVREAINAVTLTASNSTDLGQLAANLYLDHFKPIYFLFDQFEELFIFGGHAESEVFFAAMRALLEKERNAHAIFVVREEYLAELTRYERIIPGLIENRYRVERLTQRHAMEVVEKLCGAHNIPCAEGFSAALVGRLDPEGQGIELSYLQVFLDRCWRTRQGDEPFSPALLERIGHVDDMLGAFLDEQVADTPEPQRSESLLKTFVSDQGTKRQLTSTEAHDWVQTIGAAMELSEVERLLQVFVAKRLLKDRDERGRYELLHDALARQIFQRITRVEQELIEVRQFVQQAHGQFLKRGVRLTANDLTYLRPYRNQLHLKGEVKEFVEGALGEEEREARRRKRWRWAGITGLSALLAATGIYAFDLNRRLHEEGLVKDSITLSEAGIKALSGDPWMSYLLAERAFDISPTFESEKALVAIYPQLYPEIGRFKGNGFFHMPFSKALVVIDHANDQVSCYDDTWQLLWRDTIPGLKQWGSVNVLDTVGIVLLLGQNAVVRRVTGETLYDESLGEPSQSRRSLRKLVAVGKEKMVIASSESTVREIQLDTNGVHRLLRDQDRVQTDDQGSFLVAMNDSTIGIFDLNSPDLSSSGSWQAPDRLERQLYWSNKEGECVLVTQEGLYHLDWVSESGLHVDRVCDLLNRSIRPGSVGNAGWKHGVFAQGNPSLLYDLASRVSYNVVGLEPTDQVLDYDLPTHHLLVRRENKNSKGSRTFIRSFDGSFDKTICTACDHDQVRWFKSPNIEVIDHDDELDELTVIRLSWSADTLEEWHMSTSEDAQESRSALSMWMHSEWRHSETPVAHQSSRLRSVIDSTGQVLHVLLPASKIGAAAYRMNAESDVMLVTYSDSLIAVIKAPWHIPQAGLRKNWPMCASDTTVQSIQLNGNDLQVTRLRPDLTEEKVSIDLHGCLDTIHSSGYNWNSGELLTHDWTWVYHVGGLFRTLTRGYLVNLDNGTVLDTGSFKHPAKYELLPDGRRFLRIGTDGISTVDVDLHVEPVSSVQCLRPTWTQRAGADLLLLDSLVMGFIEILDLTTLKSTIKTVDTQVFGEFLTKAMDEHRLLFGLAGDENLVITCERSELDRADSLWVVERTGTIRRFCIRNHSLLHTWTEQDGLLVKASPYFMRIVNGGGIGAVTMGRYLKYDLGKHSFVEVSPSDRPVKNFSDLGSSIERSGHKIWELGTDGGIVCGDYYYSRFRAVDHYERFPLYGKEIIRLVREEKQFGEFWKHIDAEPLINKVLGTEAYNAGYSMGSLLRSTWLKLGLVLGAGVLAFVWWSRRKRLRAA